MPPKRESSTGPKPAPPPKPSAQATSRKSSSSSVDPDRRKSEATAKNAKEDEKAPAPAKPQPKHLPKKPESDNASKRGSLAPPQPASKEDLAADNNTAGGKPPRSKSVDTSASPASTASGRKPSVDKKESATPSRGGSRQPTPGATPRGSVAAIAEAVEEENVVDEETEKLKESHILCTKHRYVPGDIVVMEALDARNVWSWGIGEVGTKLSARVVEVTLWEPRERDLSDEERKAAEEALATLKEKSGEAEDAMLDATVLAKQLQEEAVQIQQTAKETEERIAVVQPLIDAARDAVGRISLKDLQEMRSYPTPPPMVMKVLECVMLLIGTVREGPAGKAAASNQQAQGGGSGTGRPIRTKSVAAAVVAVSGGAKGSPRGEKYEPPSWKDVKRFIMQENFLSTVQNYDPRSTTSAARVQLLKYKSDKGFTVEAADRASKAAGPLLQWVLAQLEYSAIIEELGPQLDEVKRLKALAAENRNKLKATRAQLRELEKRIAMLQRDYEQVVFGGAVMHSEGLPDVDAYGVGGIPFADWVPSAVPPRPVLHSSIMFAVKDSVLGVKKK